MQFHSTVIRIILVTLLFYNLLASQEIATTKDEDSGEIKLER